MLVVAFAIGGEPEGGNTRINLMDTATASGANFAAVALFVSAGFLLVIPVALFCGDTVASEAGWSSLRYLLAAPVPRMRLLWSKLIVGLGLSLAAMVLLPVVALAVGSVAYGWGPLHIPTGGTLDPGTAAGRLVVIVAHLFVSQLVTAGLAFGVRPAPTPRWSRSAAPSG
ncbi:ABC-2 type transport system permease protein OS=Streptomyces albaduncus OX=68172 GN=FHS32_000281 PE=4 SV=1 [Streptomyces griseoloalbus]